MTTANEILQQLFSRAAGTPYTVTRTPEGAHVHLDPTNMQWMGLLYQQGLNKDYTIELTLMEADRAYSQEQVIRDLTWSAGYAPGSYVPTISQNRSVQRGTSINISSEHIVGVKQDLTVGSAGYTFDSRTMADFVKEVMSTSGWTKKMDKSTRLAIVLPAAILGALVVIALIVLAIVFL